MRRSVVRASRVEVQVGQVRLDPDGRCGIRSVEVLRLTDKSFDGQVHRDATGDVVMMAEVRSTTPPQHVSRIKVKALEMWALVHKEGS